MKTTTVEAIRHKDVKGKETLYVKITGISGEHYINVGQKTFDAVESIMKDQKITNIKIDEPEKKK